MKPITRNLVSMYAAMHVLASGCATSTSRNVSHTPLTHEKITFVEQNPWRLTFDELSEVVEKDNKTVEYMKILDEIKFNIKNERNYDARQDIRGLHQDIMDSNLENKGDLAKIIENFSYYRDAVTTETTKMERNYGEWIFGGMMVFLLAVNIYLMQHPEGKEPKNLIPIMAGVSLPVIVGEIYLRKSVDEGFKQRSSEKYLVNPFSGTEEEVR